MATEIPTRPIVSTTPRARAVRSLKQWIDDGVLPHGEPLPTEQALAEKLQVSRGTLRTALDALSEEGLIRFNGGRLRIVVAPDKKDEARSSNSGVASTSHSSGSLTPTAPAHIGIIGAWTGHTNQYVWNNMAARAMEKVASDQPDVTLSYFNRFVAHEAPRRSIHEAVEALSQQGVERFAILFRTAREEIESLGSLIDFHQTPVVCIQDEGPHNLPICQVYYDLEHSGYQAADHLLRRGWKNLVVFAPFEAEWVWNRLHGIKSAIRVHGRRPDDALTIWPPHERGAITSGDDSFFRDIGREVGRQLLECLSLPCGIVAPNDMTAFGLLEAARELKLTPGVDFGIIGFDDSDQSRTLGLSSLRPPIEAMSEEAIRILLLTPSSQQSPLRVSFRSELIARTSSAFHVDAAL